MKKKLISFLLIALLVCSFSAPAFAVDYKIGSGESGLVTFTSDAKMKEEGFGTWHHVKYMEPGDSVEYYVTIRNSNSKTTRWYMLNEVMKTLEEASIKGGGYTYKLTYTGPSKSVKTLFDSSWVGGDKSADGRIGLMEATRNLENYFFLDTLNSGEQGTVTLRVGLEGETQNNTYQETLAKIRMSFAVQLLDGTAVKTGDDNNLIPYYIAMIVAGLLFLYLALDAYTDRKYKKGRG